MHLFHLNDAMDHLVMGNRIVLYSHVLRREDGHVLRRMEFKFKNGVAKLKWKR